MAQTPFAAQPAPIPALDEITSERSLESLALAAGAAGFVLAAVAALVAFGFSPAPIAGPGSIGQFAAIASGVAAALAFVAGRLLIHARSPRPLGVLDWLDVAALAFAHGVIALLGWTLAAVIMEQAFIGAEVFAIPLVLIAGATAAMTAYLAFASSTHLDLQLLAVVLAVFLVLGILASMLTAGDPQWWKDNLSALGMTTNVSARAFNLTLIVAGFIVTTLARYATAGIPGAPERGIRNVRLCLVIVGVFLGLVGVFPVDLFFAIHTGVASGMAVAFGVLVVRLPKWLPGTRRPFSVLGLVFLAIIGALAVLFLTGYYTLTAVELVAGILVFTWIILFIRNSAAVALDRVRERSAS